MDKFLVIGYRPCAYGHHAHVGNTPVAVHTVGFSVHAGHVYIGLTMAGHAVGINHILGTNTQRAWNVVA